MDVRADVPLAPRCTLGLGGNAQYFAGASSSDEVREAWLWARSRALRVTLLGGGSNVVIADSGCPGLVMELGANAVTWTPEGTGVELIAEAGQEWDQLVELAVEHDWAGLECLSGIPGRVGAAPIQNIGAYGQEVGDVVRWVETFDLDRGTTQRFSAAECGFAYRTSRFKGAASGHHVVLRLCLHLRAGGAPTLRYPELTQAMASVGREPTLGGVRREVLSLRARKSMLLSVGDPNRRSCGSFFVNPIVDERTFQRLVARHPSLPHFPASDGTRKLSAAWLIQNAGFDKGHRVGNVGLSTKHTLCVVAHDGATSREIVTFAHELRDAVRTQFDVKLSAEPEFLGFGAKDDRLPVL